MRRWASAVGRFPAPGTLNFLAGLLAGAGINLLTSAAVGDGGGLGIHIVLDSVAWVSGAALLTSAATMLGNADRQAALLITPEFNDMERRQIRTLEINRVARPVRWLLLGAFACVAVAVALLPQLARH
ncbi:hypothetical protein Ari01nite_71440 [Paractinoplanes rishiriensis]|uniref:Uncharacterized protein n=1 Tax=Paractinoplanes rishiriensis TaxID=1050105 RepID=A0A919K6N6_9ACTN|nr:hypothetical protein Ari01nite_71440 [Actinoplanes rishiriensis]